MSDIVTATSIRLEASSFCQLRCPSCPTTSGAIHPAVGSGFLRADDFRKLLDRNPEIRKVELSNYGEIFLNPEISEILRLARERGVETTAINGVNLNHVRESVLEDLVSYGLRAMTCSIDGASEETYARYRVRGSFGRVIGNIRALNRFKAARGSPYPMLRWQFVVFGHNEHEIAAARKLALELNMDFFAKLSWDPEFSPVRDAEAMTAAAGLPAASRDEYRERFGVDYMQATCEQLWRSPQINWDGKVLGCCRNFWGEFGGNAFTDGIDAAVNGDGMRHARAMLQGLAPARDDIPCTTCEIYLRMAENGQWLKRAPPGRTVGFVQALTEAAAARSRGGLWEAAEIYQAILAVRPDGPEALLGMATVLHAMGKPGEARELAQRASRLLPGDPRPGDLLDRLAAEGDRAEASDATAASRSG